MLPLNRITHLGAMLVLTCACSMPSRAAAVYSWYADCSASNGNQGQTPTIDDESGTSSSGSCSAISTVPSLPARTSISITANLGFTPGSNVIQGGMTSKSMSDFGISQPLPPDFLSGPCDYPGPACTTDSVGSETATMTVMTLGSGPGMLQFNGAWTSNGYFDIPIGFEVSIGATEFDIGSGGVSGVPFNCPPLDSYNCSDIPITLGTPLVISFTGSAGCGSLGSVNAGTACGGVMGFTASVLAADGETPVALSNASSLSAAPEPGSAGIVCAGLAMMWLFRRVLQCHLAA